MKLSNSIKLAMANFSLFWKILVYKAFAVGVIVLLFLPTINIINSFLTGAGFYVALENLFAPTVFQDMVGLTSNLFNCLNSFLNALGGLATLSTLTFVYVVLLVFVVAPFLLKLSEVPASETVYSYMSSLSRNSFTVNFIDGFGKSAGYSILKTLLEIPFWLITIWGAYNILYLTNFDLALQILCPFLLFVFIVFMADIKITIFNGWAPSIVVFSTCAGKAFKKGVSAVKRKFLSTLSSFAVVTTIMLAVLYIFGAYSLIVIAPLSALIVTVFGQVLFFESQGMNYYISPDRVIMPRKLEQADSIKKVKSII